MDAETKGLVERMSYRLEVWDDEEPREDWWPYQKDFATAAKTVFDQAATITRLTAERDEARAECERLRGAKDAAYLERNRVVALLASVFPAGVKRTAIEGWSDDWHGCVYIDLPSGQVSWHYHDSQAFLFAHLPPYAGEWDGHDTPLKYDRVALAAVEARS